MNKQEIYLTQVEQAQAGSENAIRTYLQLIPGFGGALNQAIFGTHDIMQIKRLEKFAKGMQDFINSGVIQENALAMINEYINSDDGKEYIYLIGEKVKKIRNQTKLEHLRNLFITHASAIESLDLDSAEKYLNLVDILDTEAVQILNFLKSHDAYVPPLQGSIPFSSETKEQLSYIDACINRFQINKEDLDFYHQQLISNGLAIDDGMGRLDARPLQIIKIAKRGELFLNFICSKF